MAKSPESRTLLLPSAHGDESQGTQKSKVTLIGGKDNGKEFVILKDVFTIGSRGCDITLEDTTVSRRHCEIRLTPEGHIIRDLKSTNGTLVRGVKITEAFLPPGTEFQLGSSRMVFCPVQQKMDFAISPRDAFGAVLGSSLMMRRVFYLAESYSKTDVTVLIEGETGTGKEVLAEEIHKQSARAHKPFVVIDCASLAKELVESELFGHTKGAFTGASIDRAGAFEFANGGTVFLDEIGDLALELQPKLLRVLEKREVRRVGSNQMVPVDVRIICATNHKLEQQVKAGRFREDLFYRLSVVYIEMPPLRSRKDDLPVLVRKFLKDFGGERAMDNVHDFERAMTIFAQHDWPGNVRELRNLIEIACCSGQPSLELSAFMLSGRTRPHARQSDSQSVSLNQPFKDAKNQLITDFEKRYIQAALERSGGNISKAATEAGIERAYLQRLIKKYKLKS
jgi:transcriptional regulator with PAS, ATPase and Fis domain